MSAQTTVEPEELAPSTPRERWVSAAAYLGPGFVVPHFVAPHTDFTRWHASQGFVLFFCEALALAGIVILDATLGKIPWLGLLVMIVVQGAAFVFFLVLSVLGVVKSLAGERFEIPFLDRFAHRLRVPDAQ